MTTDQNNQFLLQDDVSKPNKLIVDASQKLTALHLNILYSMFRRLADLTQADGVFYIPLDEVIPNLGKVRGGNLYKKMREQVRDLVKHVITSRNGKTTAYYNLISHAVVEEGSSTIMVQFSPHVLPIITDMVKHGYTKLGFMEVTQLISAYSKRIYEMCMLYRNQRNHVGFDFVEITIDDLRFELGIADNKYPRFSDLKRRVIDPSIKEIVAKTSLNISYEVMYKNKFVYSIYIKFYEQKEMIPVPINFKENKPEQIEIFFDVNEPPKDQDQERLEKLKLLDGIFPDQQEEIIKEHSLSFIKYYHSKVKALEKTGKLKSTFPACLQTFIKNDREKFYEKEQQRLQEQTKSANQKAKQKESKMKKEDDLDSQAREIFDALPESEQEKYVERYLQHIDESEREVCNGMGDYYTLNSARQLFVKEYLEDQKNIVKEAIAKILNK